MKVRAAMVAGLTALVVISGGCRDDNVGDVTTGTTKAAKDSKPSVELTAPTDGTSVAGNVVRLDVESSGIEIVKADGDTTGGSGHYHVFVDADPVAAGEAIPKAKGVIHSVDDPIVVTGLLPGTHTFTVVLGDGAHRRIGSAAAKTSVDIEGPGVEASTGSAPIVAGQPINLDVKAEGVTIVKADGDTSGKSGHFHVFVDKEPTPAGQAIPAGDPAIIHAAASPVPVPPLAAGEHTLWVVIGDGTHMPFDPPVMHKLTLTVT